MLLPANVKRRIGLTFPAQRYDTGSVKLDHVFPFLYNQLNHLNETKLSHWEFPFNDLYPNYPRTSLMVKCSGQNCG
jgi:hypothetical protein